MFKMTLGILLSYLMGSIPTAYLLGKFYKGIDIRQHGSGNIGATNVFRVLGKGPGIIVLIIDIIKGIVPVVIVGNVLELNTVSQRVLLGLAVVSGHIWTVFLKFKGGKGIATSLGVLIGLTLKFSMLRPVLLISISIWVLTFLLTGYVSVASILASIGLPIAMVFTFQPLEIVALGVIFCLFVVLRHRSNIKRLLEGKESRFRRPFGRP